jgi:Zn-dependent protease with chaperone function/phage FluMu protein Com
LSSTENVCSDCGWLRPLFPGYTLDRSTFLWAQDGQAMNQLQRISALNAAIRTVSDRVGRPWIESTFNGIRLGPRQFPDIWHRAVLAARLLGLPHMPDVYISGDQMWNTFTFGTENSAFIILGTAILNNFQNDELLFVLAREMGHCRAGHALWKSVTRFLTGDISIHSGLLANGLLNAISPMKLIEGTVEMPLMMWARQSEITADRAGLLAVGDEALARNVLLAWSIRSAKLLKQVNIDEWMKQEEESSDHMTRFTEMTTSSSMYTTRRLRLIGQAAREPGLMRWSQSIQPYRKQFTPPPQSGAGAPPPPPGLHRPPATHAPAPPPAPAPAGSIRVLCTKCHAAMLVPLAVLRGKQSLKVRCPKCQDVLTLRSKTAAPPLAPAAPQAKPLASPAGAAAPLKPAAGSPPQPTTQPKSATAPQTTPAPPPVPAAAQK